MKRKYLCFISWIIWGVAIILLPLALPFIIVGLIWVKVDRYAHTGR